MEVMGATVVKCAKPNKVCNNIVPLFNGFHKVLCTNYNSFSKISLVHNLVVMLNKMHEKGLLNKATHPGC
jgi:hypothetical protein